MVRRLIEGGIDGKLPIKVEPKDEQQADPSTAKPVHTEHNEDEKQEEEE